MKTEKNILIAFFLNAFFAIFEFIGGAFTNSVAIISDAIHDLGDALSIGISYVLEKISKKKPNKKYTYGYIRYSALGGLITTMILIVGSILIILTSIKRLINPIEINYDGMILLAIIGFIVNFLAAYFTKSGKSINQKSVNLHMLEDVLGWAIVLIGAIIMRFTNLAIIDPILSIGVATFILVSALSNAKMVMDLFLEKIPNDIDLDDVKQTILEIKGVSDVHHLHIWSIDGYHHYATIHVVSKSEVKEEIRKKLLKFNINHVTIEVDKVNNDEDLICKGE